MITARASVCWPLPLSLEGCGGLSVPPKAPLSSSVVRILSLRPIVRFIGAPFLENSQEICWPSEESNFTARLRRASNLWKISDLAQGGTRRGATSGILEDGARPKSGTAYRAPNGDKEEPSAATPAGIAAELSSASMNTVGTNKASVATEGGSRALSTGAGDGPSPMDTS
jgi:hypothetical protein